MLVAFLLLEFTVAIAHGQDKEPPVAKEKEPDLMARLKKVEGSFSLIVSFQVKKGEQKTLLDAAKPCIAATVKEKGCKRYELHQDLETPTKFVMFERWDSVADIEAHMGAAHTKKLLAIVAKIADGPPRIDIAKRRVQPKK
jgi:quinol monooxygenase YgiN